MVSKHFRALLCLGAAMALTAPVAVAEEINTSWEDLVGAGDSAEGWLTHHRTLDGQRYSPLDQINRGNVADLRVAFSFALGGLEPGGIWEHGGLEGTPIAEGGYLYITDGWGSVYKLDVRQNGKLVWKMDPNTDKDWSGAVQCCGVDNRGVALWRDKVVSHTLDGRLIIMSKATGEIEQEIEIADPGIAEVITAAPLIVKDMVITGVSGAEYGIRGWLNATNLTDGSQAWRLHTIPAPGEPGHETWADDNNAWAHGGGSTWVVGSYDPDLNLIYWGVGNPGPDWDNEYRPGDNLYTNSALAINADTGEIDWYFQYTPNDPYDFDGVNEQTLINAKIMGKERQAVLHADRNGFAYALDRVTGEFLWGTPFVKELNWTSGLDKVTGRPIDYDPNSLVQAYNPDSSVRRDHPESTSCPGNMGGKNWPPTAYDPTRNMYYIPVIESCALHVNKPDDREWQAREFWLGGAPKMGPVITGSVTAIDATTGKVAAKYETKYPMLGGLLTTAGDLTFAGHPSGEVVALDSDTLEELWMFQTNTGINAPPMSFSVDGKQYIALLAGLGGAWPKWFISATPGLETVQPGQMLFVFSL